MTVGKRIFGTLCILVACICCPQVNAQNSPIIYQLKTYYSTSLSMRVEVVTQNLGRFAVTPSRFWVGDNRPIKTIFCADDGRQIFYNKPETCHLIFWEIGFYRESMDGLGGRSEGDYYFNNGQWLLKESSNFPRFKGFQDALVCINNKNCVLLPRDEPTGRQLFLVWGKQPTVIRANNFVFEFFTDKQAESIDKQALINKMLSPLEYLNNLFQYQNTHPIKVVMLAKSDGKFKDAGGTAGSNAFLVNYYVKNGQPIANWDKRFIEIFLHEYIHILTPCDAYPRWACESLADYYSYKSLSQGNINTKMLETWTRYKERDPNYKLGLYTLDKRYKETKNWVFYQSFYLKGASFWNELDLLLHQKNQNLDSYLPLIRITPGSEKTELPEVFSKKMKEIVGEKDFKTLTDYYL